MVPKFRWVNLRTRDVETALAFYATLLGWQTRSVDTGGAFKHLFESDGQEIAGLAEITPWEATTPPHWLAFIDVEDLDLRIHSAERLGGKVVWGPQQVEGRGRFVVMMDPTGAELPVNEPMFTTRSIQFSGLVFPRAIGVMCRPAAVSAIQRLSERAIPGRWA